MSVKLADTLTPMGQFPIANGKDIILTKTDGTEKSIQKMYEDNEFGGSGLPVPEAKDKLLLSTENAETSELEWSQVDKSKVVEIPLYETKEAAEADIANLSDGQIIATKDEGNENAKPVDVVESGNMHAVTSNAVASALENKRTINPATSIDFSFTSNEEVNFYKLPLDTVSIEGVKSALITYGFHTILTGTSIIEFTGSNGQRFTVILSHSGTNYFGGIVITYYFPLTYLRYSNGTWE